MKVDKITCGVPGLDFILNGGLTRHRLYLVEGFPGTGKTTIALQFLLEGVRHGEKVLYITLSESKEEMAQVAHSHGWTLDKIDLFELTDVEESFQDQEQYTIFPASEVELSETARKIFTQIEAVQPTRIVFDSLSEMRLLAGDALRYRRQILALKHFLAKQNATVLLLDDRTADTNDLQLQSICHGVLQLEEIPTGHSGVRCRMRVIKLRGSTFEKGYHDYEIAHGGVTIFPRLMAVEMSSNALQSEQVLPLTYLSSGIPQFDALLNGGLNLGSSALILGPAGAGKSTIATQFLWHAAQMGKKGVCYLFEENRHVYLQRAEGIGQTITPLIQKKMIQIEQVDPTRLSPGAFSTLVKKRVEEDGVQVVVLDSLNGFLNVMPTEKHLLIHIHELLMYLNQHQVLTLLILAQHGMMGSSMMQPVDVSYMADTVLVLRYFEAAGRVLKAISVVKKRMGSHENTIREYRISSQGIEIGPPLSEFQGVLSGVPQFIGTTSKLLGRDGKR